jgi:hypothetical protein
MKSRPTTRRVLEANGAVGHAVSDAEICLGLHSGAPRPRRWGHSFATLYIFEVIFHRKYTGACVTMTSWFTDRHDNAELLGGDGAAPPTAGRSGPQFLHGGCVGLGRIVALHDRAPTPYQVH